MVSSEQRTFALAAGLLSVMMLAAIWCVAYVPTNDGPQHLFLAHVHAHYDDPGTIYAQLFESHGQLGGAGFSAIYVPLESVFSWQTAFRLTLSISALLWSWGFVLLVWSLNPSRLWLGTLGFATAFQWIFYMGFLPFYFASGFGFSIVSLAIASKEWRAKTLVALTALLFALTCCHAFAGAITGLSLALIAFLRVTRGRMVRDMLGLALVAVPSLAVAVLSTSSATDVTGAKAGVPETQWLEWGERLTSLAWAFVSGPSWRSWPPVVLCLAGIATMFVWRNRRRSEWALLFLTVGFLVAAVSTPFIWSGWQGFPPRFLPLGIMLGLALIPFEYLWGGWRRTAQSAVLTFAVASLLWAATYHRSLETTLEDALAAASAPLEREGIRLPVILEMRVGSIPYARPERHLGALFTVAQGGITPYLFVDSSALHGLVRRWETWSQLPDAPRDTYWYLLQSREAVSDPQRSAALAYYAMFGAEFEDVIVLGEPTYADEILARGYVQDYRRGRAVIARFAGCNGPAVAPTTQVTSSTLLEYGWYPLMEPSWRGRFADHDPQTTRLPCGTTWIRPYIDADGSGDFSERDPQCREADPEGRFFLLLEPNQQPPVIPCTWSSD